MTILRSLAAIVFCCALTHCQDLPNSESETRPAGENILSRKAIHRALNGPVDFTSHVKPILADKCLPCHAKEALPGHLDLSDRAAAIKSNAFGGLIIPGAPEKSPFLSLISDAPAHLKEMPVVGNQVTAEEMDILRKWIAEGAHWPSGPAGRVANSP
jgi:hypothetical protein